MKSRIITPNLCPVLAPVSISKQHQRMPTISWIAAGPRVAFMYLEIDHGIYMSAKLVVGHHYFVPDMQFFFQINM